MSKKIAFVYRPEMEIDSWTPSLVEFEYIFAPMNSRKIDEGSLINIHNKEKVIAQIDKISHPEYEIFYLENPL